MKTWTRFYFEGNLWFGEVEGPKDWKQLLKAYASDGMSAKKLMSARECVRKDDPRFPALPPKFGFAIECTGPRTLGEFFEENDLPGVIMVEDEKGIW